jgi:hypothetical protein
MQPEEARRVAMGRIEINSHCLFGWFLVDGGSAREVRVEQHHCARCVGQLHRTIALQPDFTIRFGFEVLEVLALYPLYPSEA